MSSNVIVALAGMLFAAGLALGGMTDPAKVIGFLDVFGDWDPSLAFVMGGAVMLNVVTFRWILKRPNPLLRSEFNVPSSRKIDLRLVVGSALFGIGWGIAGFCPGPALVSMATGGVKIMGLFGAMIAGIWVHDQWAASALRR